MTLSALSQLAPAYTKAVVQNRNDTVWANMERAIEQCPVVKAAPDLLAALIELNQWVIDNSGVAMPQGTFEVVQAAIQKAKG